jgi:broad specificity phosphatase PhoE
MAKSTQFVLTLSLLLTTLVAVAGAPVERLAQGDVLLLRHALAPGIGDPPDFRVDDCATQRNLNDEGRAQARAIGDWLRERGVTAARVYSSQWCRCLETAELLDLGEVTPLPALNSFFETREDREPNLAALREFLSARQPDGRPLVLVTHQVTVSALSGQFVSSGNGVVATLGEDGALRDFEAIRFGD